MSSLKTLSRRELWRQIHVSLALGAGLLFVLLGLTGSLCIYREELDELLNPKLAIGTPGEQYQPLDKIMAAVLAAQPGRHDEWVLELPRSPYSMATAWYEKPHETFGEAYAPLMVSVNPYTAEVVASRFWGRTFATGVDDWHTRLQLGISGGRIVGLIGIGLLVSVASGLYLWWPGVHGLRQALTIRHRQGWRRLLHDLHGLLGLSSAAVLLLLAFTGFHLAYPQILETLAGASGMGHGEDGPAIRSTAAPNNRPVSLAEAALIARGPFPHAEIRRIATPAGTEGTYRVNLRRPGEVNIRHPVTMVWIDRWSGQIREVRNPNRFTAGQAFVTRLWPWHTGEAFGPLGRLLWFCAGFTPLLLYVSGLAQWLMRRGIVRDRPVDFSRLRPYGDRTRLQARHLGQALAALARRVARWIGRQCRQLAHWANRQT
ncbi:MAG: PepSY-associated TM helix domain-containing protein [Candidatus Methylumidiphilus sp.]